MEHIKKVNAINNSDFYHPNHEFASDNSDFFPLEIQICEMLFLYLRSKLCILQNCVISVK